MTILSSFTSEKLQRFCDTLNSLEKEAEFNSDKTKAMFLRELASDISWLDAIPRDKHSLDRFQANLEAVTRSLKYVCLSLGGGASEEMLKKIESERNK